VDVKRSIADLRERCEGRNFTGIEIDPDYYAIARKRITEALMQPRLL
jgi:hypothetical protein